MKSKFNRVVRGSLLLSGMLVAVGCGGIDEITLKEDADKPGCSGQHAWRVGFHFDEHRREVAKSEAFIASHVIYGSVPETLLQSVCCASVACSAWLWACLRPRRSLAARSDAWQQLQRMSGLKRRRT